MEYDRDSEAWPFLPNTGVFFYFFRSTWQLEAILTYSSFLLFLPSKAVRLA
jgi:hypothetical protein